MKTMMSVDGKKKLEMWKDPLKKNQPKKKPIKCQEQPKDI